jgi:hypothetical protein
MKQLFGIGLCLLVGAVSTSVQGQRSSASRDVSAGEDQERFHPVIREFQTLIESDAEIYMGFTQMFDEIPNTGKYLLDPTGMAPQVSLFNPIRQVVS